MPDSKQSINELFNLIQAISGDTAFARRLDEISVQIIEAYQNGHKTIFCGNGGSSAEAQHLAAELSGKFNFDRKPIPAEACHVNSAFVTAVSNDYDFTKVYARYIEGFGEKGDVLIGLSTSGTSPNIVEAFKMAREMAITTVAFTGSAAGKLAALADHILQVPSTVVPRIQEIHLMAGHIICEKVEKELFAHAN